MRRGWWIGLAACAATAACAPDPGNYYGNLQPTYDGYAQPRYAQPGYVQPGYAPPVYAVPGYPAPDAGPGYVPPYGYPVPVPVTPGYDGYGYGRGREYRDPGFREREFRREFQERGEAGRRRDDQGAFNRGRFEGNRVERPRPPEPARRPPPPPPGQTPPLPNGIFPGVPRPQPH